MRPKAIGATLGLMLVLVACAGDVQLPDAVQGVVPTDPPVTTVQQPECTAAQQALDATRSYEPSGPLPPPGAMPAGSTMERILQRGRLVVGVSADTLLFGSRNPDSGAIEGFDIDMLQQVALAIFDVEPEAVDSVIEYRVINYSERLPKLEAGVDNGGVDIVAHTMTINCRRWLRIAFSSEYFSAGQKVLVRRGSGFGSVDELAAAGARVCVPDGSTNLDNIKAYETAGVIVTAKPDISDCLVAMQQGESDAITGDDTVLAGFAAQDPTTEVVGERFSDEPYGLGISAGSIDFVRFVNAVLEEVRRDGRWSASYQRWLIDSGALSGPVPEPPPPLYGREEG